MEPGDNAERGEFRLALARDHLDLGAADALRFIDEDLAILRIAASGGCDHPQIWNIDAVAERAKTPKRCERLVDCVRRQEPCRLHLATETGEHFLVEDRGRAAGEPLINYEPHRVRADVDDSDRRSAIEATLGGRHGRTAALKRGPSGVQDYAVRSL